jgi:hypothetical protein
MAAVAALAMLVGAGVALGAHLRADSGTTRTTTTKADLRLVGNTAISSSLSAASLKRDLSGLRRCLKIARHLARTGHPADARATARACVREFHAAGLLLLRRLLRLGGEYGKITFKTKKGGVTVAFERGIIRTVASGSVILKAADGTIQTWNLVSRTFVVRTKNRASTSVLAAGQRVFVVGAVVGGADSARLIIIRD